MPIGGKLLLKGGVGLSGGAVKKQKKHKSKALQPAEAGDEQQQAGAPDAAGACACCQPSPRPRCVVPSKSLALKRQAARVATAAATLACTLARAPLTHTPARDAAGASEPKRVAATAINVMSGKSYEQEFELEQERIKVRWSWCEGVAGGSEHCM
jgi:hypothetical protein